METLIQTADDLFQYFYGLRKELQRKGVFVGTKIRRNVFVDERQGKIILDGQVKEINFEAIGGGVYRAYIEVD